MAEDRFGMQTISPHLRAPWLLLKRGHLHYLSYLALIGGALAGIAPLLLATMQKHGEEVLLQHAVGIDERVRLAFFTEIFVGLLTTTVLIAVFSIAAHLSHRREKITVTALLRATPRAVTRAGGAIIAGFFRSLRLIVPVFFIGMGYAIAERFFNLGHEAFRIACVAMILGVTPFLWCGVGVIITPIVAVCGELGGRDASAAARAVVQVNRRSVWLIIALGVAIGTGINGVLDRGELPLPDRLRLPLFLVTGWYFVTALADLSSCRLSSVVPNNRSKE